MCCSIMAFVVLNYILSWFSDLCRWWTSSLWTLTQFSRGQQGDSFLWTKWRPPSWRSVKHALAIWLKTQKDSKVYCFKQELSCHSDSAAQWRVCWVYTFGGEHWAGMFGGSSSATWVKRGMYVFSCNTSADCSAMLTFFFFFLDWPSQQESVFF